MLKSMIVMGIVLLAVFTLLVCVLIKGIRDIIGQVIRTNEKLLIAVVTTEGNEAVGRALVASSRQPLKPLGGLSAPKKEVPKKAEPLRGLNMKMGAN